MLVLWDQGFDGNAFLAQVSATGAQALDRLRSNRILRSGDPADLEQDMWPALTGEAIARTLCAAVWTADPRGKRPIVVQESMRRGTTASTPVAAAPTNRGMAIFRSWPAIGPALAASVQVSR
ncbi:hypothetical protein [Nonomuraea sp. CA-141351]|uniref:hypothetical protein n=1 Tax=Nonomuraea sp. CA-141351 TaxID=3239996 RepID=UPI003D8F7BC8